MTLWNLLLPALFGWPGLAVSLALATAGLLLKSRAILFSGALFALPFGLYISSFGELYSLLLLPVGLYLAAPLFLPRDRARTAVCFVLPFFGTAAAMMAVAGFPRWLA